MKRVKRRSAMTDPKQYMACTVSMNHPFSVSESWPNRLKIHSNTCLLLTRASSHSLLQS